MQSTGASGAVVGVEQLGAKFVFHWHCCGCSRKPASAATNGRYCARVTSVASTHVVLPPTVTAIIFGPASPAQLAPASDSLVSTTGPSSGALSARTFAASPGAPASADALL